MPCPRSMRLPTWWRRDSARTDELRALRRAHGSLGGRWCPPHKVSGMIRLSRPVIVIVCVLAALVANLAIFAIGSAVGGSYVFTSPAGEARVEAVTVAGFTIIPLGIALTIVALLARWRWVTTTALILGPILELATIVLMTLPAGFDTPSFLALAFCHVALVPATLAAILLLRRRAAQTADGSIQRKSQ